MRAASSNLEILNWAAARDTLVTLARSWAVVAWLKASAAQLTYMHEEMWHEGGWRVTSEQLGMRPRWPDSRTAPDQKA